MSVRAVGLFMVLILLICVACSGCTFSPGHGAVTLALGTVTIMCGLAVISVFAVVCNWLSRLEASKNGERKLVMGASLVVAIVLFVCGSLSGCAALPMPLQPANEQYNSNMAEGGFIVLAAVDTVQTMHIRKGTSCDHEADPIAAALYGSKYPKPGRVLLTNLALITVHTMVTSWLDDKVAEHDQLQDGSVGPWYVGRVVWHGASLLAEGSAVISNRSRGCAL